MCVISYARMILHDCNLDLDQMTLIHEPEPRILKMYMKFLGLGFRKLEHRQTNTDTDRRDRTHYQPYSRAVKIKDTFF